MNKLTTKLKRASPTILSILAAGGVIGTAFLAVKATPKAMKRCENLRLSRVKDYCPEPTTDEYIREVWRYYLPAFSVGIGTIICIFSANALNRRQQAILLSSYAMLNDAYRQYQNIANDIFGRDADQKIRAEIVKDHPCDIKELEEGNLLFYDEISSRYFEKSMVELMDAEYHLNRTFAIEGIAKLNDFYELLGLSKIGIGEYLGWSVETATSFFGYEWIDFDHQLVELDDGLECYILHIKTSPSPDF